MGSLHRRKGWKLPVHFFVLSGPLEGRGQSHHVSAGKCFFTQSLALALTSIFVQEHAHSEMSKPGWAAKPIPFDEVLANYQAFVGPDWSAGRIRSDGLYLLELRHVAEGAWQPVELQTFGVGPHVPVCFVPSLSNAPSESSPLLCFCFWSSKIR